MTKDDYIKKRIFWIISVAPIEQINIDDITLESNFIDDLGYGDYKAGSSMYTQVDIMEMALHLEEEFGFEINDNEIVFSWNIVKDIVDFVHKHMEEK